jgi:hypothetical protein
MMTKCDPVFFALQLNVETVTINLRPTTPNKVNLFFQKMRDLYILACTRRAKCHESWTFIAWKDSGMIQAD